MITRALHPLRLSLLHVALLVLVHVVCSCASPTVGPPSSGASLFPLAKGNRWDYRVRSSSKLRTKTQTVSATTAIDAGGIGFVLTTREGNDVTTSLQALDGGRLVRLFEETWEGAVVEDRVRFDPPHLRLDVLEGREGYAYHSAFVENHLDAMDAVVSSRRKVQRFVVESDDEVVSVPAGTFRTVRVRREATDGPAKTYWYARGVGKVREVGGKIEELEAFRVEASDEVTP